MENPVLQQDNTVQQQDDTVQQQDDTVQQQDDTVQQQNNAVQQQFIGVFPPYAPIFPPISRIDSRKKTKSARAGLRFTVGRFYQMLRQGRYANHITLDAAVFLSAVIEYMCVEVLELSGNVARGLNKKTITPRQIMLAIRNDEELNILLHNVIIPSAGVIPHIHRVLLFPKSSKSKSPPDLGSYSDSGSDDSDSDGPRME